MIPIRLTLEGLYSYQKQQTIDFSTLISNQLFGIFGQVGSGKSTILEAMMFAIYGETDRLSARGDNRNYNMMNLKSDRLLIDLECYAGEQCLEEFRFVYEAKRNSKNFQDVKSPARRVMKKIQGNWVAMEDWEVESIMGMSAKHFRQTVIIPQGKFREFIDLGPTDRTRMLQELFQLDKFDLFDKTKQLIAKNSEALTITRTKLEGLEEFSKEVLDEKEIQKSEREKKKEAMTLEWQHLQEQLGAFKELEQLFREREYTLAEQQKLVKQKTNVLAKEQVLELVDLAERTYKERLRQLKELAEETTRKHKHIGNLLSQKEETEKALLPALKALEEARLNVQQKEEQQAKLEDLTKVIGIMHALKEMEVLEKQLGVLVEQGEKREQEKNKAVERQDILLLERKKLVGEKQDTTTLKDVEGWHLRMYDLKEQLKKIEGLSVQYQNTVAQLQQKKGEIIKKLGLSGITEQVNIEQLFERIKSEKELLHEAKIAQQLEERYKEVRQQLKAGEPCPVCGATEHPGLEGKVHAEHDKAKPEDQKLAKLEKAERYLQELQNKLLTEGTFLEKNKREVKEVREIIRLHKNAFVWDDFQEWKLEKVQEALQLNRKNEIQLQQLDKQSEELRQKERELSKAIDQHKLIVNEQQTKLTVLRSNCEKDRNSLKVLAYDKMIKFTLGQLETSQEKGREKLKNIDKILEERQRVVDRLEKQLAETKGQLKTEQVHQQELKGKMVALEGNLLKEVEESPFESLEHIREILNKNLNVQELKKQLEAYKEAWRNLELKLAELEGKIAGKVFDKEAYQNLLQQIEIFEKERLQNEQQLAVLQKEIEELIRKLEEKKELQKQTGELDKRRENLKTLQDLFKSKGFVEYVSSIYLKELVYAANQRFMKLTHSQMSLELNDRYEFIVRDYLNNGRTRLLKTLSGGQTFQAALCLALALAENVKALNRSEQSFFFLDEGFGTLDKQSLSIVFDTLRALQQENRIVGIISHVEELQQEIDVALKIENHSEEGSIVKYSWQMPV
ncbi:SbcC/MukB-like Walker B domain-containing protein [Rapidithrix thailandica]|uniref:SbcC/MukB-like Walker B domain-containing protein n=1 Tax=Rapidithrix thailandica TaxID=413964 RepID=A0AAW9S024_9BACT